MSGYKMDQVPDFIGELIVTNIKKLKWFINWNYYLQLHVCGVFGFYVFFQLT